jgi:hypothetical protein
MRVLAQQVHDPRRGPSAVAMKPGVPAISGFGIDCTGSFDFQLAPTNGGYQPTGATSQSANNVGTTVINYAIDNRFYVLDFNPGTLGFGGYAFDLRTGNRVCYIEGA